MDPDPGFHAPGDRIAGRYSIDRLVGRGNMGAVYEARDSMGQKVALKQVLASLLGEYALECLATEAGLLKQVSHPSVPRLFEVLQEGENFYLAMEFVPGPNLLSLVEERPLKPLRVVEYAFQISQVLQFLHKQPVPIVFGDLKPANVILREGTRDLVLVDFGIARPFVKEARIARVGTPGYAPLEQLEGRPEPRSDVYALGATMYHLLTGKAPPPFQVPPLEVDLPGVHPGLAECVFRATQLQPEQRFPSAARMGEELQRLQAELALPPVEPPCAAPERPRSGLRRVFPAAAVLMVALVVSLAVAGAVSTVGQNGRPPVLLDRPGLEFDLPVAAPPVDDWAVGGLVASRMWDWRCLGALGVSGPGRLEADAGRAAGLWLELKAPTPRPLRSLTLDVRAGRGTSFLLQTGPVGIWVEGDAASSRVTARAISGDRGRPGLSAPMSWSEDQPRWSRTMVLEIYPERIVLEIGERTVSRSRQDKTLVDSLLVLIPAALHKQELQLRNLRTGWASRPDSG